MASGGAKKCSRCDRRKPLDAFSKFFRGHQGRQAWCKSCMREHWKEKQYRSVAMNP